MKTTIINLSALAILVSTSFFAGRIDFTQDNEQHFTGNNNRAEVAYAQTDAILTEAVLINGEIIPVVTLPELTIEADYPESKLVHAFLKDGNVVPYVTLPTLNIEG